MDFSARDEKKQSGRVIEGGQMHNVGRFCYRFGRPRIQSGCILTGNRLIGYNLSERV